MTCPAPPLRTAGVCQALCRATTTVRCKRRQVVQAHMGVEPPHLQPTLDPSFEPIAQLPAATARLPSVMSAAEPELQQLACLEGQKLVVQCRASQAWATQPCLIGIGELASHTAARTACKGLRRLAATQKRSNKQPWQLGCKGHVQSLRLCSWVAPYVQMRPGVGRCLGPWCTQQPTPQSRPTSSPSEWTLQQACGRVTALQGNWHWHFLRHLQRCLLSLPRSC